MGIKKIARPMNKAKNAFVKWMKENDVESMDSFEGEHSDAWDYYRSVDGFIDGRLYCVIFSVWNGKENIDYKDEENRYPNLSILEFMELIK
jgi:hypothetical protein